MVHLVSNEPKTYQVNEKLLIKEKISLQSIFFVVTAVGIHFKKEFNRKHADEPSNRYLTLNKI